MTVSGSSIQRVLVIDDKPVITKLVGTILEDLGYDDVVFAENGEDALVRIDEAEAPFSLVICDLHMPKVDGFSFVEVLREDKRHYNTPVIMVSSVRTFDDGIRLGEVGANAFLAKPFTSEQLNEKIRHVFGLDHMSGTA